jgi:hypothetical protein
MLKSLFTTYLKPQNQKRVNTRTTIGRGEKSASYGKGGIEKSKSGDCFSIKKAVPGAIKSVFCRSIG